MNSVVLLVPSHHNFSAGNFLLNSKGESNEVIELTEEMLGWEYHGHDAIILDEFWVNTYHNALEALLNIPPFDAQVSIWANVEKKHICLTTHREWAVIFLNGKAVAYFSHDTRFDNPFEGLIQWTEQADDGKEKVKKLTVDQWKDFFYGRIRKIAKNNLISAEEKMQEAQKQKKEAENIILAIPV